MSRRSSVEVTATCRLNGRTGVEMEALTAVSVACLTLYDMCKAVDKDMEIGEIRLESKTGGKSGDYRRAPAPRRHRGRHGAHRYRRLAPCRSGAGAAISPPPCIHIKCLAELRERLGCQRRLGALR